MTAMFGLEVLQDSFKAILSLLTVVVGTSLPLFCKLFSATAFYRAEQQCKPSYLCSEHTFQAFFALDKTSFFVCLLL